ncbi:zinc-binding alcohol dehydrogenase family protein [Nocardia sp. NPDC050406]|uniref:zinc-binding alcohol dehydrogenase family protein n=1 Tax=Nocardia sp. NPDC050406 TaxID=3364318 RepID=UPI0037A1BB26
MRKIRFVPAAETIEVERPRPEAGQLLIRTELSGVGIGLVRMIDGGKGADPGGEIIGEVVEVGPDVAPSWLGRRVGGVVFAGLFAEYALAAPQLVTEVPDSVPAADALGLVRGGLVALGALRAGRFAPGESVLVTGAASGVGHLAVQLAKADGARRVIAAASTADKAEFLRECGADEVVDYVGDWGEPVDVVLDGIGGKLAARGVAALGPHGRLVAFSAGGGTVELSALLADLKTVTGFSMGLLGRTQPELIDGYRRELFELYAAGRLRPHCTVVPVEQVGEAVDLVVTRRNLGRVAVSFAA